MKTPKSKQMIAIERFRNERGLSQKELSELAGMSVRWYQKLLKMDRVPDTSLVKLSSILNININELTEREIDNLIKTSESSMFLPIYTISTFNDSSLDDFSNYGMTLPSVLFDSNKTYTCLSVDTLDYIALGFETNDLLFIEHGLVANLLLVKSKQDNNYLIIKKGEFNTNSHELIGGVMMTLCKTN